MALDHKTFFDEVRGPLFGQRLTQRQVQGMEPVLEAWEQTKFTDLRWLAYAFATVRGEDGSPMYPVHEVGYGRGHPYGVPGAYGGQVPYGRGYIQTTWDAGYEHSDKGLAAHGVIKAGELLADFDLLLQPKIAAPCLLYGLAEGWYTRFKLSDYLNDKTSDFLHCRRIVNSMDRAAEFAAWAQQFYSALVAAQRKGGDATAIVVAKVPPAGPSATSLDLHPDVLSSILEGLQKVLVPQAPGPAAPPEAPLPGPVATPTGDVLMNPMMAITLAEQVMTYLPTIEKYAAKLPEMIATGKKVVGELQKLDFSDAVTDIETLAKDLGFGGGQNEMAAVISHATVNAPPKG